MIEAFILLFVTLLAYLIGDAILAIFRGMSLKISERILFSVSLGFGVISLSMFFLGLLGLMYITLIRVVSSITLLVLLRTRIQKGAGRLMISFKDVAIPKFTLLNITVFITLLYILFNLLRCMTPVINGDSLFVYLQIPKLYAESHEIFNIDWNEWGNLPLGVIMLNAYGILLYSDILSQLISGWLMGLLCSLAVYVIARNFVDRKIATIAAIIFYTIPTLSWLMYSTKIDLGYTFFELCFWAMFVKWMVKRDELYLYISAMFLGFAIGSKYHALFALVFAASSGFALLLVRKIRLIRILYIITLFCLIALAVGSPSYIKNYVYTSHPFYPFLTHQDSSLDEGINQYKGILDFVEFQYNMFLNRDFIFKPRNMMDKPIGVLPLLVILLVPFGFKKSVSDKRLVSVVLLLFGYYLLLSFVIFKSIFPYPRHFLPAIGLLVAISSIGINNCFLWVNRRIVYLSVIVIMCGTIVLYNGLPMGKKSINRFKSQLMCVSGAIDKEGYLDAVLFNDGRHMNLTMLNYVKTMPEDTRIAALDYGNGYYVGRPFIKKGYFYTITDLDSLKKRLKSEKITHIFYSIPVLDEFVTQWQGGKYSPIYNEVQSKHQAPEFVSNSQYLYKIVY